MPNLEVPVEARVTLNKWGNGAGFLVPKKMRDELGVKAGDELDLVVTDDGGLRVSPVKKRPTLHDLMAGYEGPVPEFIDPGESKGREIW